MGGASGEEAAEVKERHFEEYEDFEASWVFERVFEVLAGESGLVKRVRGHRRPRAGAEGPVRRMLID